MHKIYAFIIYMGVNIFVQVKLSSHSVHLFIFHDNSELRIKLSFYFQQKKILSQTEHEGNLYISGGLVYSIVQTKASIPNGVGAFLRQNP